MKPLLLVTALVVTSIVAAGFSKKVERQKMDVVKEIQLEKTITLEDGLVVGFPRFHLEVTAPPPGDPNPGRHYFEVEVSLKKELPSADTLKFDSVAKPTTWNGYEFTLEHIQLDRNPRAITLRIKN